MHVGARQSKDPTILESLSRPLTVLAQQALFNPEHALSGIRAIIALCLWPMPMNSTFHDPSHALSGAAVKLAIQKGLPFASRNQDFARVPTKQAAQDRLFRSRLWVFTQMLSQASVSTLFCSRENC